MTLTSAKNPVPLLIAAFLLLSVRLATAEDALHVAPDGNVGLGVNDPKRQLHLSGSNAVFRMDRSLDTAAFLMVRTTADGTPLKTFVVGTNAAGPNDGEFIINDIGQAVSGDGARRMTIRNDGTVIFPGMVQVGDIVNTSSGALKEDIKNIDGSLALIEQLQGVRFNWKESGDPAIGFIAEDVGTVLPEAVRYDEVSGQAIAVSYSAVIPILVEAVKEQQKRLASYEATFAALQVELQELRGQVTKIQDAQTMFASSE